MISRLSEKSAYWTGCNPIRVTKEMIQALPPLYRAVVEVMLQRGDPSIVLTEGEVQT